MTKREQKERAKIKKELQQQGILPPNKPRLDRKKFVEDAAHEWDGRGCGFLTEYYLHHAIGLMLGRKDAKTAVRAAANYYRKTAFYKATSDEYKKRKNGRRYL